jgi:hypothetical protein
MDIHIESEADDYYVGNDHECDIDGALELHAKHLAGQCNSADCSFCMLEEE